MLHARLIVPHDTDLPECPSPFPKAIPVLAFYRDPAELVVFGPIAVQGTISINGKDQGLAIRVPGAIYTAWFPPLMIDAHSDPIRIQLVPTYQLILLRWLHWVIEDVESKCGVPGGDIERVRLTPGNH